MRFLSYWITSGVCLWSFKCHCQIVFGTDILLLIGTKYINGVHFLSTILIREYLYFVSYNLFWFLFLFIFDCLLYSTNFFISVFRFERTSTGSIYYKSESCWHLRIWMHWVIGNYDVCKGGFSTNINKLIVVSVYGNI